MTNEAKLDQNIDGDNYTTTVQLTVHGDVQVTVVLQKGNADGPQNELAIEAVGKAIELLRMANIPESSTKQE